MAFAGKTALAILDRIGNDNRKGEFYLTDAVAIARDMRLSAVVVETEEDEVLGINTKAQLAEAEAVVQQRLRKAAMEAGVTHDRAGDGVPLRRHHVRPRRRGRAERRVRPRRHGRRRRVIRAFSHLEGAHVGEARWSARMRGCGPARSSASTRTSAISSRSRMR